MRNYFFSLCAILTAFFCLLGSANAAWIGGVTRGQLGSTANGQGVDLVQNAARRVDDYAALRALVGAPGKTALVEGRTTPGDGGGGLFRWEATDQSAAVTADSLGGVYVPPDSDATGASGAWVRNVASTSPRRVEWFGGVADSAAAATANAAALRAAVLSFNQQGGTVRVPSWFYVDDVNLTDLYFASVVLEGHAPGHQNFGDTSKGTVIVTGATSQGFDLSGTSGVVFKNISFRGDPNAPPRCAIFAQRTAASLESWWHKFDHVRTFGEFSQAAIYNVSGEGWQFDKCYLENDADNAAVVYLTTKNTKGLTTKFATPSYAAPFLTLTKFSGCWVYNLGANSFGVYVEEDRTGGAGSATVENLHFDFCYFSGLGNASVYLENVYSLVSFRDCRDENYATANPAANAYCIQQVGDYLHGLSVVGCRLQARTAFLRGEKLAKLMLHNNFSYSAKVDIDNLSSASVTWLTGFAEFKVNAYVNNLKVNKVDGEVVLPAEKKYLSDNGQFTLAGTPYNRYSPNFAGDMVFDSLRKKTYKSFGTWKTDWEEVLTRHERTSLPSFGSWDAGDLIWHAAPVAGGNIGWVCLTRGTFSDFSQTGNTQMSSPVIVGLADTSGVNLGDYVLTPAGFPLSSIPYQVIDKTASTLTLGVDGVAVNALSTQIGVTFSTPDPVFAAWGDIAP